MSLKLNSSGGGSVTLQEPSTASNVTLDLPATAGTIQVSGAAISGTTGTFTGLLDISAATAGQIRFPATQNASSNANTLDDYEEGTWTPTDLSGAGLSLSVSFAHYAKVGRVVTACFYITFPATGSGAAANISLPFTVNNYGSGALWTSSGLAGVVGAFSSGILLRSQANGTYTNSQFSSQFIIATVSYLTDN